MAGLAGLATDKSTANQRQKVFVPKEQRRDLAEILGTQTLRQTAIKDLDPLLANAFGQFLPSNAGALNGQLGSALSSLRNQATYNPSSTVAGFAKEKATPVATDAATASIFQAESKFDPAAAPPSPLADKLVPANSLKGLGSVSPTALLTAREIATLFGNPLGMGGVGPRGNKSDHPGGKAVDVMVTGADSNTLATGKEKSRGDGIVSYLLQNWQRLGIKYVIWNGNIWNSKGSVRPFKGSGGDGYGGKHGNHVHISFIR